MANILQALLGPLCTVDVEFTSPPRAPVTVKGESGKAETLPLYTVNDTVRGQVTITPMAGKKVDHQGIKVELLGTIELFFDRGNTYDFSATGACVGKACAVRICGVQTLTPLSHSPRAGAGGRAERDEVVWLRVQQC